jgi:hypothetical protein
VINEWSDFDKLGAAEVLYCTLENRTGEEQRLAKRRINEILSSLINHVEKVKDPNIGVDENVARALFLGILVTDRTQKSRSSLINNLTHYDPRNGLAWIFKAEELWMRGRLNDLDECTKLCHKAIKCPVLTLRDRYSRKRMLSALQKAHLADNDMMRSLVFFKPPLDENKIFIQHASLLSFLDTLQNLFGIDDPPMRENIAREYLSLTVSERMMPQGVFLQTLHGKLLQKELREKEEIGISSKKIKHLEEEDKLFRLQHEALKIQVRELDKLGYKGKINEIKQFLIEPDEWWAQMKSSYRKIENAPDATVWRGFWQGCRKELLQGVHTVGENR